MPPIPVLVALADATRCRIITILRDGPLPVHALAANFAISRPAISRHLRVLKQAGLISEDKQGRENLYRLHAARLEAAHTWLGSFIAPPLAAPAAQVLSTEVEAVAPANRPRRQSPVSQMGFDF